MSDSTTSNYLGKCPECKDIMIKGQHLSYNSEDLCRQYHSSCLIEKLKKELSVYKLIKKDRHLTYLASPYTHSDPMVLEYRFSLAVRASYNLIKKGEIVFSPIAHTHTIALIGNLPPEWEYWNEFDTRMINACDSITVLKLDGWKESTGVKEEIKLAKQLNKQLRSMEPISWEVSDYT